MTRRILGTALLLVTASAVAMAAPPTTATIIKKEDVDKVLQLGPKATDHTIRVVDMGQNYQMSVAVVHRGSTHAAPPVRTPAQVAAAAAAQAKQATCGMAATGSCRYGRRSSSAIGSARK